MKNFKLLLATTAMLSMGLAMNVIADDEPTAATYTGRVSATLRASISIFSPITMNSQDGYIYFPAITTTPKAGATSAKVKVNHDGTIDYAESTAQILSTQATSSPIIITGGNIGSFKSSFDGLTGEELASLENGYNSGGSWAGGTYKVHVADEIPMYVQNTDTLCGTVGDLEKRWHYDTSLDNGKGGFKLNFGGTFTLDSDFSPDNGQTYCSGSTTVTLLVYGADTSVLDE